MGGPLEGHAFIGDGQTAAPVSRDGSIDRLCWPRFDGDSRFAAPFGEPEHGRWLIGPMGNAGPVGSDQVVPHAPVQVQLRGPAVEADLRVAAGQRLAFVFRHHGPSQGPPPPLDPEAAPTTCRRATWPVTFRKPCRTSASSTAG